MPSPIAHTAVGYIIHRASKAQKSDLDSRKLGRVPLPLVITVGASMLPDIDALPGIILNDFGRYHNNGSHSVFVGFFVAILLSKTTWGRRRSEFLHWLKTIWLCYLFHIILDYFTIGRGVMLFWPLSSARFSSPLKLFYGFHWSDGFVSVKHIITFITELAFSFLLIGTFNFIEPRLRKFVYPQFLKTRQAED